MMRAKAMIIVALLLIMGGCRTYKVTESHFETDTVWVRDTFFKALHRYTEQTRQVYDSTHIDYKIGMIDTHALVRVDTFIKVKYVYCQAEASAVEKDSTASGHNSSQTKAVTETKVVEPAPKKSIPWLKMFSIMLFVCIDAGILWLILRKWR